METYYTCRIDTTQYSGNFERQMVAFISGMVGDCDVGAECLEAAEAALPVETAKWLVYNVMFTADGHGCHRPAEAVSTPGGSGCQSVQMRFGIEPPQFIQDFLRDRAQRFPQEAPDRFKQYAGIEILDVVFSRVEVTTTTIPL
jgi:hypothetical protein